MDILLRAWAVFVIAARRLFSRRWLALATAVGLITSVALITSVPLYADAIYDRVLREKIGGERIEGRAPFIFLFRYVGTVWGRSVEWEDTRAIDQYLSGPAGAALGLPQKFVVRYFKTDRFELFPDQDVAYADTREMLTWVNLACASDLENHIAIQEGRFPTAADPAQDGPVEVLISDALAVETGVQVGETYVAYTRRETGSISRAIQIPVRVAGVWKPLDPQEAYWFHPPETLSSVLFMPEETFSGRIRSGLEGEVGVGLWYLVMDGSDVRASDVVPLLGRIAAVRQRAASLLPNTSLDVSPVPALQEYWHTARLLTVSLYAFSVPIVGLILAFIGLVVGLTVGRQRHEIAIMRSRGATTMQMVSIAALEGALLGVLALAVGLPVGEAIAYLIGKTRSFLDFTLRSDLRVDVTGVTVRFGMAAMGLALAVYLVPTLGAARQTIIPYKQERARLIRPPWWQRAWLDILLFIPAAYGFYLLKQQGSVVLPVGDEAAVGDPFQNPLLFLVPALGMFALTLFILRLVPAVMAATAWGASQTGGVSILLAARHLSRTPGFYAAPLALLVLTLSLSTFTASLAQTLDSHLYDQAYYQLGADMRLAEGQNTQTSQVGLFGASSEGAAVAGGPAGQDGGPRWLFVPVSEYLRVPGVQAAARVGRYEAVVQWSGGAQGGKFIGLDRVGFAQAAFWRQDFAPASLGALMNALARQSDGVLVPRDFMGRHALQVGDILRVKVSAYAASAEMDVQIVGAFDLFPTWYPEQDGPLFVGNLETLFGQMGGQIPYDAWLKIDPGVEYGQIVRGLCEVRQGGVAWDTPQRAIAGEQQRPERQGLFGLLSVGFLASALLTVTGFVFYASFSFHRRFVDLGVLRAIGLSAAQMAAFLAWELVLLILAGVGAGTGLGAWTSVLFIPYLQIGSGPSALIPPFVVEIAWPAVLRVYGLFGLLFLAALGVLVMLLLRMKVFQAIKLGETV